MDDFEIVLSDIIVLLLIDKPFVSIANIEIPFSARDIYELWRIEEWEHRERPYSSEPIGNAVFQKLRKAGVEKANNMFSAMSAHEKLSFINAVLWERGRYAREMQAIQDEVDASIRTHTV